MKLRNVILWSCLIGISGAGLYCTRRSSAEKSSENSGMTLHVGVCRVIKDSVPLPLSVPGRLATSTELRLGFRTGGIIRRIFVDEGMVVNRGMPLARLDTVEFAAWRVKAQAAQEKARRDLERAERLYADSVATHEQLQNARSAFSAAMADLAIAQFNCEQAVLTAPARGKVLKRYMEKNEVAGPGIPVIVLASTEESWIVKASVPDVDLPLLTVGDSAQVRFDAVPGRIYLARLTKIAPVAHPVTGTFEIECALDNNDTVLRHGLFAGVTLFPSKEQQYFFIPASALAAAEGDSGTVVAAQKDGRSFPVRVAVERMFGDYVAVTGDLASVNEVVSTGAAYALTTNDSLIFDR